MAAYDWWDVNLIDVAEPERLQGALVSWEFFDTLQVRATHGRTFSPEEGTRGRHLVAVVSHAFWMRRFGGGPVINRTLNLDGEGYTVVGIAPEHFAFPDGTEVWAPLLVDGDMATMMSTFGAIALLLAAVGIYGVMSYSVNQRRHEIGIRMALGAGSRHIIQLVLRRVARLVIIGVAFGLIFAYGTSRVIVSALESVGSMDALTFVAFAVFLSLVALARVRANPAGAAGGSGGGAAGGMRVV